MSNSKRTAWASESARKQLNQNLLTRKNANDKIKLSSIVHFLKSPMLIEKIQVGNGEKRNLQLIIIYDHVLRIDILINAAHKIKGRPHYWKLYSIIFFTRKAKESSKR